MEVYVLLVEGASDAQLPAQNNKDFVVATASDEEKVLRLLKTIRPDTIIIDLTIPGLNGPKLIGEIRLLKGCEDVLLVALINRTSGPQEEALAAGATVVSEKREWARTLAEMVKGGAVLRSEFAELIT